MSMVMTFNSKQVTLVKTAESIGVVNVGVNVSDGAFSADG
jgi:hypothetical protein